MPSNFLADGKSCHGLELTWIVDANGFIIQKWAGSTLLQRRMAAFGYETKQMVGDGPSRESTLISLEGEIRHGFIFRGNSKDELFFLIIPPNQSNREIISCEAYKEK
ncbi:hypothetical protein N9N13_05265 [Opitutales bacterium]|nr:hypothetical protein [Opitutales bacterium]